MTEPQFSPPEANVPPLLSTTHQRVVACITLFCLITMGVYWVLEYQRRGRPVNVERPFAVDVPELIIDLNRAPWHELTLLPGISETMARRIVDYRAKHGRFESVEQIQGVPGIGPRTLERLAPFVEIGQVDREAAPQ